LNNQSPTYIHDAAVFPDLPELTFQEDAHIYTLGGVRRLPSVTHIMRFMSRELYDGIPYDTLDNAARRGALAHEQAANLDLYGYEESDEDTRPYIEAYKRFLSDYRPRWTAVEWRGYHRNLLYTGTIDRAGYIGEDDGRGVDIVDLKCTRAFHPVMLGTQIAAYAEIAKSHGIMVRKLYGLQLLQNEGYVFQEVPNNFITFLHCLGLNNEMAKESRA